MDSGLNQQDEATHEIFAEQVPVVSGYFFKIERPGVCTTCWANRWVPFAEGGCLPFRSLIRSGSAVVLHCFRNGSALLPQWFFTASAVIRAFCKSSRIAVEKKRNVR